MLKHWALEKGDQPVFRSDLLDGHLRHVVQPLDEVKLVTIPLCGRPPSNLLNQLIVVVSQVIDLQTPLLQQIQKCLTHEANVDSTLVVLSSEHALSLLLDFGGRARKDGVHLVRVVEVDFVGDQQEERVPSSVLAHTFVLAQALVHCSYGHLLKRAKILLHHLLQRPLLLPLCILLHTLHKVLHQLRILNHLAHLQPTAVTGLGGERFRLFFAHLVDLFNGAVLLTTHEFDVDYLVDDGDVVFVDDEV